MVWTASVRLSLWGGTIGYSGSVFFTFKEIPHIPQVNHFPFGIRDYRNLRCSTSMRISPGKNGDMDEPCHLKKVSTPEFKPFLIACLSVPPSSIVASWWFHRVDPGDPVDLQSRSHPERHHPWRSPGVFVGLFPLGIFGAGFPQRFGAIFHHQSHRICPKSWW